MFASGSGALSRGCQTCPNSSFERKTAQTHGKLEYSAALSALISSAQTHATPRTGSVTGYIHEPHEDPRTSC